MPLVLTHVMCRAGRPNAKGMEELLEEWLAVEDVSDNEFIDMLTSYALPAWDHRTHLRIAWLHLTTHGRREGMKLIFTRIKDFVFKLKAELINHAMYTVFGTKKDWVTDFLLS